MQRNVIVINEDLCDGCGECVTSCVEGALQLIDGKARLISEMYCDGLGACIGNCPQGAITVIQKECEPYDEIKTLHNIMPQGEAVIIAHLKHLYNHGQMEYFNAALGYLKANGYSISVQQIMAQEKASQPKAADRHTTAPESCDCGSCDEGDSRLQNWPIQMHLVNPMSDSFCGRDVLIAADCVPFALHNFHEVLLKDKAVVIACPKLDSNKEAYLNKLVAMLQNNRIASLTAAIMEVPCCGGLVHLVRQAIEISGVDIPFSYRVVGIEGKLLN